MPTDKKNWHGRTSWVPNLTLIGKGGEAQGPENYKFWQKRGISADFHSKMVTIYTRAIPIRDSNRFDSLCESIRIDSFSKKIDLSIH